MRLRAATRVTGARWLPSESPEPIRVNDSPGAIQESLGASRQGDA